MKVKFITLGCKVNQYESDALAEKFREKGVFITPGVADIYVINSCSVTHRADKKSRDAIVRSKKENPGAKIVVCGCFVVDNESYLKSLGVDILISPDEKHLLPEMALDGGGAGDDGHCHDRWSLSLSRCSNYRAFVKIQDGCDNRCSFCKIPHLRGPSRSRPHEQVLEECRNLSRFHKEIILCGVNISLYGRDHCGSPRLKELIADILRLPRLGRVRLSSLEPYYVDGSFFSLLKDKRFCAHLHLPFQYGEDSVLRAMNKRESVALYEEKVRQARENDANVAISCDLMVGFPGENEATFKSTVDFVNRVKPMRTHIFTFSPRQKTPLAGTVIKNSPKVKERYRILKDLTQDLSRQYSQKFLGKALRVIAEQEKNGFTCGRSENYLTVNIEGHFPLGSLVEAKVTRIEKDHVYAKPLPINAA
jgi:threonylcarbamoyladenosine tRNA methylthiotransferase MtaB